MSRLFFNSRNNYHLLDDSDDVMLNDVIDVAEDADEHDNDSCHSQNETRVLIGCIQKILRTCTCFSLGSPRRLSPKKHRIIDIFLSVFCLLVVTGTCLSLGYYAVLVRKPELVIDKSYQAFRIPNHEASLNFGALQNAKTHYTPFRKMKYDLLTKWAFTDSGNLKDFGFNKKNSSESGHIIGKIFMHLWSSVL